MSETRVEWHPHLFRVIWDSQCQAELRYKRAQAEIAERDKEIAALRAECNRRGELLAAVAESQGGWVAVSYLDLPAVRDLDVFGWRGELIVLRIAEKGSPVGDELADALDAHIAAKAAS